MEDSTRQPHLGMRTAWYVAPLFAEMNPNYGKFIHSKPRPWQEKPSQKGKEKNELSWEMEGEAC